MGYQQIENRLRDGGVVILDGGTGTELERRGVEMDTEAWCGPASLAAHEVLVDIHHDYIKAGADIITANTFASSRLMLSLSGLGDKVDEINRAAIRSAKEAKERSGNDDITIAGSLSHMFPMIGGSPATDLERMPSEDQKAEAFGELANILADECDVILLEMMYHPERMEAAFKAAKATGKPVWAGFSARRGEDGSIISFATHEEIPFRDVVAILKDYQMDAAGIMHSSADVTGEALEILKEVYDGPLTAYPDSGHFEMPSWQFEKVMKPAALRNYCDTWRNTGAQVFGGCCGLSPEHIGALASMKDLSTK